MNEIVSKRLLNQQASNLIQIEKKIHHQINANLNEFRQPIFYESHINYLQDMSIEHLTNGSRLICSILPLEWKNHFSSTFTFCVCVNK